MSNLAKLPTYSDDGDLNVVIEVPKGSTVKLKYVAKSDVFEFGRALSLGVVYPFDWGFIPSTQASDGDPLDAMVLLDAHTFPGVLIPSKAIGVVELEQDRADGKGRQRNDRIIATPARSRRAQEIDHVKSLAEPLRKELEQFFVSATFFEPKNPRILGWKGPRTAAKLIEAARKPSR